MAGTPPNAGWVGVGDVKAVGGRPKEAGLLCIPGNCCFKKSITNDVINIIYRKSNIVTSLRIPEYNIRNQNIRIAYINKFKETYQFQLMKY